MCHSLEEIQNRMDLVLLDYFHDVFVPCNVTFFWLGVLLSEELLSGALCVAFPEKPRTRSLKKFVNVGMWLAHYTAESPMPCFQEVRSSWVIVDDYITDPFNSFIDCCLFFSKACTRKRRQNMSLISRIFQLSHLSIIT